MSDTRDRLTTYMMLGQIFHENVKIARDIGDPKPWPELETDPDWPGFAILRTGREIYYVGRAAAFHDQGSELGEAIDKYLRDKESSQ